MADFRRGGRRIAQPTTARPTPKAIAAVGSGIGAAFSRKSISLATHWLALRQIREGVEQRALEERLERTSGFLCPTTPGHDNSQGDLRLGGS